MIERILHGTYEGAILEHVRMGFSRELDEAGKFLPRKLSELIRVFLKIVWIRVHKGVRVLYYPPAGPNLVPVLRDIFLLSLTRPLFNRTIFHFHAGGLHEIYQQLPAPVRLLFRWSYFRPDVAIRMARSAPGDPAFLHARHELIVPYGVPDEAIVPNKIRGSEDEPLRIFFVGVLREDKGVRVLLEALGRLKTNGVAFRAVLMGKWVSRQFQEEMMRVVHEMGIDDDVEFPGVLAGVEKSRRFREAEVLCFPSFFDSEAFPVSLIEGLCYGLPIVSTHWRGIPDIVEDGVTGVLVPPQNVHELASALTSLASDPVTLRKLAENARTRYLQQFTIEKFHERMEHAFAAASPEADS